MGRRPFLDCQRQHRLLNALREAMTKARAVQLLLGHTEIESTVWYLGIEIDDAIEIAVKVDI